MSLEISTQTIASEDADKGGVQSVETAAHILRAISMLGGAAALKDIAAAAGMPRGKAHRYLVSLTRAGLAVQEPTSGAYAIGPLAITLGLTALRRISPMQIAAEALSELRDKTNETAALAIWGEFGPTVIALEESINAVTLNVRVGSRLPLFNSAVGRIFLTYQPDKALCSEIIKEERVLDPTSPCLNMSVRQKIIEETRAHGMARVAGDLIPGINALAAPIFDHSSKLAMAIGLVGRKEILKVGWTTDKALALKTCAAAVSEKLGFQRLDSET
ncbi:MAG: IclR family transcriptional regulator [Pseudomonadota bacterium]